MKLCKITCLIPAGVVVEDLGVRLPGRGSSQTVRADSVARSKDLARAAGLVRVESVPEPRPMPFWPFIKKTSPPSLPPSSDQGISERLEELGRAQKEILELLRAGSVSGVSSAVTAVQPPSTVQDVAPEPVFIPSQIVPRVPDLHVKARDEDVEKKDMDASLTALRKLRKGR